MNYIKEINAFYQRQETNPLSAHAASLWHTLMHVNNRAGWKKKFTVAVAVLCSKGSLSNSTFKRARTELRDKGYIHYESQRGNQAAIYEIISSEEESHDEAHNDPHKEDREVQTVDQKEGQNEVNTSVGQPSFACKTKVSSKKDVHLDHKPAPLLKQKETKQRTTTTAARAIDFFQFNFNTVSPFILQDVVTWVHDVGEPLVVTAMKRALERGKANWGYCKGILQSWLDKGFKTAKEAETELSARNTKHRRPTDIAAPSKGKEVIPDWFKNRHKQQAEAKEQASNDSATDAKKRMDMQRIIAKYG